MKLKLAVLALCVGFFLPLLDMRPIETCQHCLGCRIALVSGVGAQTLWLSFAGLWPLADHFVQGDSQ